MQGFPRDAARAGCRQELPALRQSQEVIPERSKGQRSACASAPPSRSRRSLRYANPLCKPTALSAAVSPRSDEQPNFAAFIKGPRLPGRDVFARGLMYVRAAGTCPQAAPGSGLSPPPPPPSSKEASALHRLPHPRVRQAHGTARQSEGTKGRCFPRLPLMQELAAIGGCSPVGWDCSQTPRRLLILREAV